MNCVELFFQLDVQYLMDFFEVIRIFLAANVCINGWPVTVSGLWAFDSFVDVGAM